MSVSPQKKQSCSVKKSSRADLIKGDDVAVDEEVAITMYKNEED